MHELTREAADFVDGTWGLLSQLSEVSLRTKAEAGRSFALLHQVLLHLVAMRTGLVLSV